MCECGCSTNADRYKFPGPGNSFYVISMFQACVNCDGPPGITIELIEPGNGMFKTYSDFLNGDLKFENWPDSKGVAIVCGMLRSEFVKALSPHLVGVDSDMFDDETEAIDEDGAEVILEEMYEDSQVQPHIVKPKKRPVSKANTKGSTP